MMRLRLRAQQLRVDERGSASVEMVLLTPLVLMLLLFLVFCGRVADARLHLADAAHQAARAATLTRAPADAVVAVRGGADAALAKAGLSCRPVSITTDTSAFRPGGAVTVTLTCRVLLTDLVPLGVPGHVSLTARSTSPVDRYRSVEITRSGS